MLVLYAIVLIHFVHASHQFPDLLVQPALQDFGSRSALRDAHMDPLEDVKRLVPLEYYCLELADAPVFLLELVEQSADLVVVGHEMVEEGSGHVLHGFAGSSLDIVPEQVEALELCREGFDIRGAELAFESSLGRGLGSAEHSVLCHLQVMPADPPRASHSVVVTRPTHAIRGIHD